MCANIRDIYAPQWNRVINVATSWSIFVETSDKEPFCDEKKKCNLGNLYIYLIHGFVMLETALAFFYINHIDPLDLLIKPSISIVDILQQLLLYIPSFLSFFWFFF